MTRRRRSRQPRFDPVDPLLDASPVATLDLHGFTASEADGAVRNFLQTWQRRAPGKIVHVVTGKGRGSVGGPVLRTKVGRLLKDEMDPLVRTFVKDVNEGGYMVELR
jgi:DNA-nicking Smr family endonuclease